MCSGEASIIFFQLLWKKSTFSHWSTCFLSTGRPIRDRDATMSVAIGPPLDEADTARTPWGHSRTTDGGWVSRCSARCADTCPSPVHQKPCLALPYLVFFANNSKEDASRFDLGDMASTASRPASWAPMSHNS